MSWLEEPQIVRVEVTEGHRVLLIGPLVKIEGLEFGDLARIRGGGLIRLCTCNALQSLDPILEALVRLYSIGYIALFFFL